MPEINTKKKTIARKKELNTDGYVNVLNKYGTRSDSSAAYHYQNDGIIPDALIAEHYETNALFAKIVDIPAQESLKKGFEFEAPNKEIIALLSNKFEDLKFSDNAQTGIKWARLFGGALGVMLIDDGGALDTPLDLSRATAIEEILVFDRSVITPDFSGVFSWEYGGGRSNFGMPSFYNINSIYGNFRVHYSRCLVFKNGIIPEKTFLAQYRFWGIPEYVRIKRELRETVTTHGFANKMLERSVQAVYKMMNLEQIVSTEQGENAVVKRLNLVDKSRGLFNSIVIDKDGEDYDFKTFSFSGVKDVVDTTCNMLSAVTNIPQSILFGRSPAGMNSTGKADLETYYNYVEQIQNLMLKTNVKYLADIILKIMLNIGEIKEIPKYKIKFNELWSESKTDAAQVEKTKAETAKIKADTAAVYANLGVLDPTEIRKSLAESSDFDVETILDNLDENLIFEQGGETQNLDFDSLKSPQKAVDTNDLTNENFGGIIDVSNLNFDIGNENSGRYPKGSGKKNDKKIDNSTLLSEKGVIRTPQKYINVVCDLKTGQRYKVTGSRGRIAILAKGTKIRVVDRLVKHYGGDPAKWQKKTEDKLISMDGSIKQVEIHSYYEPTIGYVEPKIKTVR